MDRPPYLNEISEFVDAHALAEVHMASVRATDGFPLDIYELGRAKADKLLLVNSPGMPFLLFVKLATELSRWMHVITWDSRGCPDLSAGFDDSFASIERQSDDLLRIVEQFPEHNFHVATWSSGAFVLLNALTKSPGRFLSKTLLAPNDLSSTIRPTSFQRIFLPLFESAAKGGAAEAQRLQKFIAASQNSNIRSTVTDKQAQKLATMFARNPEAARRYAVYFHAAVDFRARARELFRQFSAQLPFLIVHASDDPLTDYHDSLVAFEEAAFGSLSLKRAGGHYLMWSRHIEIAADIRSHAAAVAAACA